MSVFECRCGIIMSTPKPSTRCIRCRRLLGPDDEIVVVVKSVQLERRAAKPKLQAATARSLSRPPTQSDSQMSS